MTHDDANRIAARARRTLDDLERARDAALRRADAVRPPRAAAPEAEGGYESASTGAGAAETAALLRDGALGLERLLAGEPPRTPQEALGVEAIIQLEGRPAIRINGGHFDPPPDQWEHLELERQGIERVMSGVGRVQATPAPHARWLATAFAISPTLLVTNRHVAEGVASTMDDVTWTFNQDTAVSLDFVAERPELGAGPAVVEIAGVHDTYDLAVVRIAEGPEPPPAVTLMGDEPAVLDGSDVYVVGHPVQDGGRNDPVEMQRIFEGVFRVKRLQPGKSVGLDVYQYLDVLGHDCSTLGGNSGSCVADLATHRVIALHFRGDWQEVNHAVPLWRLVDDPLLAKATFA